MSALTLVIMAAGLGSRFGGLKQLAPVGPNGETILHYSIFDGLRAGFTKIVIILRPELVIPFRADIGKWIETQCELQIVTQEVGDLPGGLFPPPTRQKPWGTAHAIWCCHEKVTEPFAVLNADDYYGRSSFISLANFLQGQPISGKLYGLVGYRLVNTLSTHGSVARAVCVLDKNQFLLSIEERTHIQRIDKGCAFTEDGLLWTDLSENTIVSMNMWGFTPTIFNYLENRIIEFFNEPVMDLNKAEIFLPNVVGGLLLNQQAQVKVLPTQEQWFGITYPDDLRIVNQMVAKLHDNRVYPAKLAEGRIGPRIQTTG
jgi:NDP-sugar pyrophosphorylase family protein